MTQTHFSITVGVSAPQQLVWSVMTDIERWPEWTRSISRVKRLSPGPLGVGSRVRIHQPKLPPATWQVTELEPGTGFTWVSIAPGLRVTARHTLEALTAGCRVTLSICYEGVLGPWLARWTRRLNDRYLAMEARGLLARCTELAAKPCSPAYETDRRLSPHQAGGSAMAAFEFDEDPQRGFSGAHRKREHGRTTLATPAPQRQYAAQAHPG